MSFWPRKWKQSGLPCQSPHSLYLHSCREELLREHSEMKLKEGREQMALTEKSLVANPASNSPRWCLEWQAIKKKINNRASYPEASSSSFIFSPVVSQWWEQSYLWLKLSPDHQKYDQNSCNDGSKSSQAAQLVFSVLLGHLTIMGWGEGQEYERQWEQLCLCCVMQLPQVLMLQGPYNPFTPASSWFLLACQIEVWAPLTSWSVLNFILKRDHKPRLKMRPMLLN